LRDLGSRNGTYVNATRYSARAAADSATSTAGATAAETDLQHGDRIKVGHTVIEIRVVN
jgi:pSer/pThr/pTyr-binding forkhead associated (FHA) protein